MAFAIATLLVAATGCTNDTLSIDSPAGGNQGKDENRTTIQVTLPDGNGGKGAQTRTDYEDDPDPAKGVKVTWRTGDKLRVFGVTKDGAMASEIFTLKGDGGDVSGSFEGIIPKPGGKDAYMYSILYPSTATRSDASDISMEGQMQSGDQNRDHLGDYDVLLGVSMKLSDSWNFTRHTTMLRFDIDLSGSGYDATLDGVPYAIVLSSSVESTFYKGFPTLGNETNSLTLSLKDIDINTSKKFTAYMMALPFKLSTDFSVSVLCSNGYKYTATRTLNSEANIEAGKRYTFTMKGGSGETWTKTPGSASDVFVDGQEASENFSGGDGSSVTPYLISSAADLTKLRNDVNVGTTYSGKFFKLTTDIRVVAAAWTPIGGDSPFEGTFDGNGHTISGQLIGNTWGFGFFGCTKNATISNLTMEAVIQSDGTCTGSIAGYSESSTLVNCTNRGTVTASGTVAPIQNKYTGGIVGNPNATNLIACVNKGAVSGADNVGGLAGGLEGKSKIIACANTGAVTGKESVGGIAGYLGSFGNTSNLSACYSTGVVSGPSEIGAIVGKNSSFTKPSVFNTITSCHWVAASDTPPAVGGDNQLGISACVRHTTIESLNGETGVDVLNAAIDAWNTVNASTPNLQCPYIFAAGSGEEPPTLVVATPK